MLDMPFRPFRPASVRVGRGGIDKLNGYMFFRPIRRGLV